MNQLFEMGVIDEREQEGILHPIERRMWWVVQPCGASVAQPLHVLFFTFAPCFCALMKLVGSTGPFPPHMYE